jgi:predicted phosphohydrolase
VTDPHLNFVDEGRLLAFLQSLRDSGADVLLLGGDIGEAHSVVDFLRLMDGAFTGSIYFVLGNHDFYGSSISSVREAISRLASESQTLTWLSEVESVGLCKEVALIGHDGWGDARMGNFLTSSVELNDFYRIEELAGLSRSDRVRVLNELGEEAAAHIERALKVGLESHEELVLLTHVPPFHGAGWRDGELAYEDWLPYFSCGAVGEVLVRLMSRHPGARLTALCGHTHSDQTLAPLPNVAVYTGGVSYGSPRIQKILELGT